MAYSFTTYSVHCNTLITLSSLLINYASVMTPWIVLAVHQYWPMFAKDLHIAIAHYVLQPVAEQVTEVRGG